MLKSKWARVAALGSIGLCLPILAMAKTVGSMPPVRTATQSHTLSIKKAPARHATAAKKATAVTHKKTVAHSKTKITSKSTHRVAAAKKPSVARHATVARASKTAAKAKKPVLAHKAPARTARSKPLV